MLFAAAAVAAVYLLSATGAIANAGDRLRHHSRIAGFDATNVSYTLDPSEAAKTKAVDFDLDVPAREVRVKLRAAATDFATCVNTAGLHWSCAITEDVEAADRLTIVAVE